MISVTFYDLYMIFTCFNTDFKIIDKLVNDKSYKKQENSLQKI